MSQVTHGFWYYNWGNAASVAGLVLSGIGIAFTLWTLAVAKSARLAATQARDAANIRSLMDEIRRGELLTRDLASHLSSSALQMAQLRSADLLELLGWVSEYWVDDLNEHQSSVVAARNDIDIANRIIQRLVASNPDFDEKEADKAAKRINQTYKTFVRVRAALEKRRNNDGL